MFVPLITLAAFHCMMVLSWRILLVRPMKLIYHVTVISELFCITTSKSSLIQNILPTDCPSPGHAQSQTHDAEPPAKPGDLEKSHWPPPGRAWTQTQDPGALRHKGPHDVCWSPF